MAITTMNQLLAGMQPTRYFAKGATTTLVAGRPVSLWSLPGSPGAGAYDNTLNGIALSSTASPVAGTINFVNPPVSTNSYLARLQANASQSGVLLLVDRLWHNGGYTITSTAAQSSTTPTWPARDGAGLDLGYAVVLGVEVSVATGAGTPTITVSYTNQAGTAGRTATNIIPTVASSAAGSFYMLGLQAGDTGVRSVQSLTLSATWTSGTINLVAFRVIAALELAGAFVPNAIDALTGAMPHLHNGSVLNFIFLPSTTTATAVQGSIAWSQG